MAMVGILGLGVLNLAGCADEAGNGNDHGHAPEHPHDHDHGHDDDHHHDHDHDHDHEDHDLASFVGDPYPLAACPVSGEPLDAMGSPVSYAYEEREVKFCCPACDEDFEDDAETYLAEIDEQIVAQQAEHYPLEECPVSGEPLGSMGEPVDYVWHNRLVRFCCSGCIDDFEQEAQTHLAALDEAVIAQQREAYPLEECVVSNEPLDAWDEQMDVVVANRLVRTCCEGCVDDLYAHPAKVFTALDRGEPLEDGQHEHHHDDDH